MEIIQKPVTTTIKIPRFEDDSISHDQTQNSSNYKSGNESFKTDDILEAKLKKVFLSF